MATWLVPGRALSHGPQPFLCRASSYQLARSGTPAEDTHGQQRLCVLSKALPQDGDCLASELLPLCLEPMVIAAGKDTLDFWLLSLNFWGCPPSECSSPLPSIPSRSASGIGSHIWFTSWVALLCARKGGPLPPWLWGCSVECLG